MRRRLRGLVRGSGICLAAIVPFLLLSAGSATAPAGAASRLASAAGDCPGKAGTGTLTVTITIEPGHPPVVVNVSGPGFQATINTSKTFCVAPGTYTVVGQPLRLPPDSGNPDGSTLYATVTGSPAVVVSGQNSPVTVDYGSQVPVTTKALSNTDVTQHITSISSDESVIVFASLPPSLKNGLHPGDVLVAGPTTLTPYGLLRKVVSVSTVGGVTTVTTTQAEISDAATQGSFDASTGSQSAPSRKSTTAPTSPISYECGAGGSVTVDASDSYSASASAHAKWHWGLPPSFSLDGSMRVDEDMRVSASASGTVSCDTVISLVPDGPIGPTFVVFVGPVPFTFTPVGKVDLTLHGEGTFASSPTASIEHSAYASANFSLHGTHIDASADSGCNPPVPSGTPLCTTLTLKPSGGPTGQVKASVGPTVYLAVDYVPHEVITGPYLEADGYVQADFQTQSPVWKVTAGIEATVGARFKVFIFDIDASTQLFDTSTVLAQAGENTNVLVYGPGDLTMFDPLAGEDYLTSVLTSAGYDVTESPSLPSDLSGYSAIWYYGTAPINVFDAGRLEAFVQAGNGLYLTGERPCCEDLNASVQPIVNSLVIGGGVQVGGLGDPPYFYDTPVFVNALLPDGVAQNPFTLTTWLPIAPGAMAGVAPGNVFATGAGLPLGAVWDSSQVVGGGRLVVLMDINWLQPDYLDPFTAPQVAQNLELFLSNLSEPPAHAVSFVAPPRVHVAPAADAGTTATP